MIAIIDYETGNLRSVENLCKRLSAEYIITSDIEVIERANKVILPGVGAAADAMQKLKERNLIDTIKGLKVPTIGICLGMQLMCSHSEEGDVDCLGIFPNKVRQMKQSKGVKVPHIGWNTLTNLNSALYKDMKDGCYVYFVHSFSAEVNQYTAATTTHDAQFSASLHKDNFYGCQFHPEKSGDVGEQILSNFLAL